MSQDGLEHQGVVSRVTDFGLAFITDKNGDDYCFRFNRILGYRGEYPHEIGLKAGRKVRFLAAAGRVRQVDLVGVE